MKNDPSLSLGMAIGCSKTYEKASREAAVKSRSDEALNVFLDSAE